ncbi:MAG: Rieske (2Fe-2S) protein [Myxococcota bacterium]
MSTNLEKPQRESDDITVAPDGRPMAEQPEWRREFPVDWPADEYVSRRAMVKFMTLTSLAFVGGHAWLAATSAGKRAAPALARAPIARVADLAVGGVRVFQYPAGSPPRILVRLDAERFVAYDQACTHLSCPVVAEPKQGKLHCPCHNGWFDLASGRPVAGPPRRALPRVTLVIEDGVVYATGIVEGGEAGEGGAS